MAAKSIDPERPAPLPRHNDDVRHLGEEVTDAVARGAQSPDQPGIRRCRGRS